MTEDTEIPEGIHWDAPLCYDEGKLFTPIIQENGGVDKAFNAIALKLDGTTSSHLEWGQARLQAEELVKKGCKLFWELDLGLFHDLKRPLNYQTQYLSLELSLKHFRDYIWKEFGSNSLGVCLYKGSADLSQNFHWEADQISHYEEWKKQQDFEDQDDAYLKPLFCQNLCLDYLQLLTHSMPDEILMFLLMDDGISDLSLALSLLHPERYHRFQVALKNSRLPQRSIGWEQASPYGFIGTKPQILDQKKSPLGICLPALSSSQRKDFKRIAEIIEILEKQNHSFRLIPESFLLSEWDELSELIVITHSMQPQGIRKLKGFHAAGGKIIYDGLPAGLDLEISFDEWNREALRKMKK